MKASEQPGFKGMAEVLETLAALPTPGVASLVGSRRADSSAPGEEPHKGLSPGEEREWDGYQSMEHLVRIAKAEALAVLRRA